MVQSIDNGFNRANYSAVKININKPEVFANGANNQNPVVTNPINVNGNNIISNVFIKHTFLFYKNIITY